MAQTPENRARSTVVEALQPLHAIPVENGGTSPGTPDINYSDGWIELKYLSNWPKKPTTIVRIDHYTKQQRIFAIRRIRRGANCFLLLKVGRLEWLLFDGVIAAQVIGISTREELYGYAYQVWKNGLDKRGFFKCMSHAKSRFSWIENADKKVKPRPPGA